MLSGMSIQTQLKQPLRLHKANLRKFTKVFLPEPSEIRKRLYSSCYKKSTSILYDVYNQHTINILYFVRLSTKFTTEKLQHGARGSQKSELLFLKQSIKLKYFSISYLASQRQRWFNDTDSRSPNNHCASERFKSGPFLSKFIIFNALSCEINLQIYSRILGE